MPKTSLPLCFILISPATSIFPFNSKADELDAVSIFKLPELFILISFPFSVIKFDPLCFILISPFVTLILLSEANTVEFGPSVSVVMFKEALFVVISPVI